MNYRKDKPVTVVDPDIPNRTLVDAWDQGTDEKTGDRLVILDGEPAAVRRIAPRDVYDGLRLVVK